MDGFLMLKGMPFSPTLQFARRKIEFPIYLRFSTGYSTGYSTGIQLVFNWQGSIQLGKIQARSTSGVARGSNPAPARAPPAGRGPPRARGHPAPRAAARNLSPVQPSSAQLKPSQSFSEAQCSSAELNPALSAPDTVWADSGMGARLSAARPRGGLAQAPAQAPDPGVDRRAWQAAHSRVRQTGSHEATEPTHSTREVPRRRAVTRKSALTPRWLKRGEIKLMSVMKVRSRCTSSHTKTPTCFAFVVCVQGE